MEKIKDFKLSKEKLNIIKDIYKLRDNELKLFTKNIPHLLHYINLGDLMPAVVYRENPFVVSVYTDEFDAVVLIRFADELRKEFNLKKGSRLLASCVYYQTRNPQYEDHIIGFDGSDDWRYVKPYILDFLVEDDLNIYKQRISEFIWDYVLNKTKVKELCFSVPARVGFKDMFTKVFK